MSFHRKIEALFADFKSLVFAARFTVQMGNASKQQKTSSSTAAAVSKHQPANQQQEEDVDFWLDGPAGEDQDHTQQQEPDSSSSTSLITLDKVRSLAREYRGRELPGYTPYKVLEVLVDQHKDRWGEAAKECLGQVAEQLTDMSLQLVQQQFGQFAAAEEHVRWVQKLKMDRYNCLWHVVCSAEQIWHWVPLAAAKDTVLQPVEVLGFPVVQSSPALFS